MSRTTRFLLSALAPAATLLLPGTPALSAVKEAHAIPDEVRSMLLQALAFVLLKWTALVVCTFLLVFMIIRGIRSILRSGGWTHPARKVAPRVTPRNPC